MRLRRRALHARRALRRGRAAGVRRAVREGLHLPRPLHGQLGSGQPLGDLRPRGRGPRGHRHALLHRLPAGVGLAARSRSPPCAPRRCSPTPRSRCTPTTSATARLIGEKAILPLVGRKLKIIADEYVKPEFGTGALKITPGHDPNDFEIGRRHGLARAQRDRRGRADHRRGARAVRRADRRRRRSEAVVAELREQGLIARTEPLHAHGPVLAPLGRADRAADLAAVVHADGRARAARRSRRCTSGRDALPPRALSTRVYLDWMENIRPVVHLAPAVVGPPAPGLVPASRARPTSASSRPRATAGSATPTCSTPGSRARCGRSRRSAGPSETPRAARVLPDRRARHRARHHLPVGRADDHDGARVHRRDPVRRRLRALDHPGARRPADVEVARHRDRPARPDRRRRRARRCSPRQRPGEFPAYGADAVRWGLLAMSSGQDVRFSEEKVAQGQQLTNKLWNASRLILLGVGPEARAGASARPPSRTAGSCRGCERAKARGRGADRALRLLPRGAGALRLRLRRAVRLVPRAGQAAAARRRAGARRDAAARAHRDARARPPDDPVRDRGDLPLRPGRRGAARGARPRPARTRRRRRRPRRRWRG